ncbi:MAG TPA: PhzF family phenazine biosynthesis protein [Thermoplasmata archaeon]|nr:PhzF family phenazine biosynthesis protein [Thermoplasmata archaeon]
MGERFYDFWRVDVFTDKPLQGNPLAVFPRATGLSREEMEGITREMNLSETTFVFPPTNPAAHYRNRIFTPGGEIPFAGHPSLGTAYVAALEGLVPKPEGRSVVYQELEIGVLPLELFIENGQIQKVVMTQGEPSVGRSLTSVEGLAKALSVRPRDLGKGKLKPQVASTGIPSLQVPMRSLAAVQGIDYDMRELGKFLAKLGPHHLAYVFSFETTDPAVQVHARAFSPQDAIREDPATGSAAGACGTYLAANGALPAPSFVIEQGLEMKHASRIEVSVEAEGKVPKAVKVGGRVTPLIRGSLRLPG